MDFIVEKKGMNFMEAVQAMKKGKNVRRSNTIYPFYYTHEFRENKHNMISKCESSGQVDYKYPTFDFEDIEATDWEIVEEKKTLSDKLNENLNFKPNTFHHKELKNELRFRDPVILIMEKEQDEIKRCKELFKEALKKFIETFPDSSNNEPYLITIKKKAKEIFGDELI